jgi:hypothetical protein
MITTATKGEIRSAVELWHRRLRGLLEPPPANVVALPLRA